MFSELKNRVSTCAGRLDVRLTASYTLILLTLSLVVCLFCYYRLQHLLLKQIDKILIDETHELIDDANSAAGVQEGCRRFEQDISRRKYYQLEFRLLDRDGRTVYESPQAFRLPAPANRAGSDFATLRIEGKRSRFRVYQRPITAGSQDLLVQIATTVRPDQELLERFSENVLWALPLFMAASILLGMLAARKPCRIIRDIAAIADRITSDNLHERLPVPSARDEVRTLTETINTMIERLETSFAELRRFTADVSHELRNPLFALRGNMEVALERRRDAAEYRDTISDCLEKIDFLIKLVNDLFLVSRFETGKINLEAQVVNIADVVQDIVDFYTPMAQERGIALTIPRRDSAVALADKTRLLQLLSNLLDNALKFTPEGGSVRVALVRDQHTIRIEIADSGVGIPDDAMAHIFDRFYQVDAARSGEHRGAGLGLQICKRIVEAHGWTIAVRRNDGPGVTFSVTIPVKQ